MRRRAQLEPADIELNLQFKPFSDVGPKLVLEDELSKHCNVRAVSTRVVVLAPLREEVFRLLHDPAHHCYKATSSNFAASLVAAREEWRVCFCESLQGLWLRSSNECAFARAVVIFASWSAIRCFLYQYCWRSGLSRLARLQNQSWRWLMVIQTGLKRYRSLTS